MPSPATPPLPSGFRRFLFVALLIALGFTLPLIQVVRFSLNSDLYSHIVLLPFITGYLIWIRRNELVTDGGMIPRLWPALLGIAGLGLLAAYGTQRFSSSAPPTQDELSMGMGALVLLLGAAATICLSRNEWRIAAFPIVLLVFLVPFPLVVEQGLETASQHGSAWVAHVLFEIRGTPVMRNETYFRLPGFSMQVAPECSGIRSTFALFLTSLVAGHLLLRSTWKRAVLTLVVIPIALVRNGFRVFVIGELCVRISPDMIDSWIHRHGGPFFFALSLIPFFLILVWLLRPSRGKPPAPLPASPTSLP